ncbi:hypothetical protein [Magnetospirillum sp. UT-4]|uniref:hypothetical protein n=1 Tax=Magnetospirillum sp. UT-4 TaxID=2681467 RepID=UPI0015721378|nr:hypothetical protein [Magnetospirillum sp. UT-4]
MARLTMMALVLAALWGGPAVAAERALDLLDAPVAYTADFYVTGPKGTYRGTVWHAPGRERRDFDTQGGGQTLLLRRDTDSAYLMKPSGKWYVGLGFSAIGTLAGGLDKLVVERTRLGEDVVAGIKATRYRITAAGPKGGRFDGEGWFSRDGVLVKAAGTATDGQGRRSDVETGLSRLKLGRVDERVFELPSGWFGMDLRSVPAERIEQAVESLRPLLEGRSAHQ